MNAHNFPVQTADGATEDLSAHKGKLLLIVNVASKCGLTPQYEGLEALHRANKDKGLQVVGFPCNQFGDQEPGDDAEIQQFCSVNYNVTFPVYAKLEVNGDDAHPLYQYLRAQAPVTSARTTASSTSTSARPAPRRSAPTRSSGTSRSSSSTGTARSFAASSRPSPRSRSPTRSPPCSDGPT